MVRCSVAALLAFGGALVSAFDVAVSDDTILFQSVLAVESESAVNSTFDANLSHVHAAGRKSRAESRAQAEGIRVDKSLGIGPTEAPPAPGDLTVKGYWLFFLIMIVLCLYVIVDIVQQRRRDRAAEPGRWDEIVEAKKWSDILRNMALVGGLGLMYMGISAVLIFFNKYLMHKDRFPHALNLTLCHQIGSSAFTGALFVFCPCLFPSLRDPEKKVQVDRGLILSGALPISVLFAGQLFMTNLAYLYSNVSFIQMMKEGNMVLVYGLSLLAGMEIFSRHRALVLVCIVLATCLTIKGEINFNMAGFVIQLSGQGMEASRIVFQAVLMCANGSKKLDPLTYTLLVAPLCAAFLALCLGISTWTDLRTVNPASWEQMRAWSGPLLANTGIAIALNITSATFIKYSSAVAFILAGILKDILVVLVGVFRNHETISSLQIAAFSAQILFIALYSIIASIPARHPEPNAEERGVLRSVYNTITGDKLKKPAA